MSKVDANDYSRFKDIDDSDEELESKSNDPSKTIVNLVERMLEAHQSKEKGNDLFEQNDLAGAKSAYEDALNKVSDYNEAKAIGTITDAQLQSEVRNLVLSLRGNLAMVASKESSFSQAITQSTLALKIDPNHVKSLYRRGSARAKLLEYEEAKDDLKRALELEPTNAAAKKELAEVLKALKEHKAKSKNAFGSIFSKGSVYDDKEAERRRKEQARIEAKMAEEAAWQQDNAKRLEEGLAEQNLDEYRTAKEAEAKAAEEKAKGASSETKDQPSKAPSLKPTTPSSSSAKPTPSAKKAAESTSDDADYDEEEAKIIAETKAKGYCYFRTPAATTANISRNDSVSSSTDATPSAVEAPASTPVTAVSESPSSASGVAASSWNYAGTWEERDMSQQVKAQITTLFDNARAEYHPTITTAKDVRLVCHTTKVDALTGEAQIVLTRGKKRHLFDFTATVDVEITVATVDEAEEEEKKKQFKTLKGTVSFTDISPQSALDYTVKWKKSVSQASPEWQQLAKQSVQAWHRIVVEQMRVLEEEYQRL